MISSFKKVITKLADKATINSENDAKIISFLPRRISISSPTPYQKDIMRWHQDTSLGINILLLHDIGTTSKVWSIFNNSVAKLAVKGAIANVEPEQAIPFPIHLYMPSLRNHGDGLKAPGSCLGDYVDDVINFASLIIEPRAMLHVIGHGFGGRLAMLAALTCPTLFDSITVITEEDPFRPIYAPKDKLELLKRACAECSTLQDVDKKLSQIIRDETERLSLLSNARVSRIPRSITSQIPVTAKTKVELMTDVDELLTTFSSSSTEVLWPKLSLNGCDDTGAQDEILAKLGRNTAKIPLHIIKSENSYINKAALDILFKNSTISEMPTNLNFGALKPKDAFNIANMVINRLKPEE